MEVAVGLDRRSQAALTPLTYVALYGCLLAAVKAPFGDLWRVAGVGAFLAVSPVLFPRRFGPAWAWFAACAVVVGAGLLLPHLLSFSLVIGLALFGAARLGARLPDGRGAAVAWAVASAAVVALTLFPAIVSRADAGAFDLLPSLLAGAADPDVLFHNAIISMIADWKIPSTGLHFAPYYPYQHFAHTLFAAAGRIVGEPAYRFYFACLPLLVAPFALIVAAQWASLTRLSRGLAVPVFLLVCLWGCRESPDARGIQLDPSTLLGIGLFWLAVYEMETRQSYWPLCAMLPVAFAVKIPTAAVMASFLLAAAVVDRSLSLRKRAALAACTIALTAIGLKLHFPVAGPARAILSPVWLSLKQAQYSGHGLFHYLWDVNHLVILFWALLAVFPENRAAVSRRALLLAGYATVLALVFSNLASEGSNNRYIVLAANWICGPLAFLLLCRGLERARPLGRRVVSGLVIGYCAVGFVRFAGAGVRAAASGVERPAAYRRPDASRVRPYLDELIRLRGSGPGFLVEIPESETEFWNYAVWPGSRYWMPFYIPILSGHPAFGGFNPDTMPKASVAWYGSGYYSYQYYYPLGGRGFCDGGGFAGKIVVRRNASGAVVSEPVVCGSAPGRQVTAR